jgi:hypothetical protein
MIPFSGAGGYSTLRRPGDARSRSAQSARRAASQSSNRFRRCLAHGLLPVLQQPKKRIRRARITDPTERRRCPLTDVWVGVIHCTHERWHGALVTHACERPCGTRSYSGVGVAERARQRRHARCAARRRQRFGRGSADAARAMCKESRQRRLRAVIAEQFERPHRRGGHLARRIARLRDEPLVIRWRWRAGNRGSHEGRIVRAGATGQAARTELLRRRGVQRREQRDGSQREVRPHAIHPLACDDVTRSSARRASS